MIALVFLPTQVLFGIVVVNEVLSPPRRGVEVPEDAGTSTSCVRTQEQELTLVDLLLLNQQQLTAVEEFAFRHDNGAVPDQAQYYAKLLPTAEPKPGEQYAFEVDLDRCSGCKACVTACHAMNGLDEEETWREVGLLIGGTESSPIMQHVTAACHHCLEPGCLNACPVDAYEKDPVTGIVRHLDDQCFGCQYCTLACPYDVPKFHAGKGIVRKCDMCSQRLSQGEAPACVQACPHEAIAIRIVEIARIKENAEADNFLPASPETYLTLPATTYKTRRVFPRNLLPADYYSISPQHPHWPLIVMLVLTQLSVGAFVTGCLLEQSFGGQLNGWFRPFQATTALLFGLLALAASTLHLGRPQYAFRGILGLRHSWLSREILAFGVFAGLAVPYAVACWFAAPISSQTAISTESWSRLTQILGFSVAAAGISGVFCSAMIYVFTKRELWSFERTLTRFVLTSAVLGIVTTWLSFSVVSMAVGETSHGIQLRQIMQRIAEALVVVSLIKLVFDALLLGHLTNFRNTPLKRSALLITGVLRRYSWGRLLCGLIGGVLIPWIFWEMAVGNPRWELLGAILAWTGCLIGELLERYLFFAAVSSARMPGGVRP